MLCYHHLRLVTNFQKKHPPPVIVLLSKIESISKSQRVEWYAPGAKGTGKWGFAIRGV